MSRNISMKKVYEELSFNIMTKFTGDSALWNMSEPELIVIKKFIIEEVERVQLNNLTDDVPIDIEKIDVMNFKLLLNFYQLFLHHIEKYEDTLKPNHVLTKHMDWSTRAAGRFFIKNLKIFKDKCIVGKELISKLHQAFTLPKQKLSLPYIASLYSANDFRTLTMEMDFDVDYFAKMESCIQEVLSKTFDNQKTEQFFWK